MEEWRGKEVPAGLYVKRACRVCAWCNAGGGAPAAERRARGDARAPGRAGPRGAAAAAAGVGRCAAWRGGGSGGARRRGRCEGDERRWVAGGGGARLQGPVSRWPHMQNGCRGAVPPAASRCGLRFTAGVARNQPAPVWAHQPAGEPSRTPRPHQYTGRRRCQTHSPLPRGAPCMAAQSGDDDDGANGAHLPAPSPPAPADAHAPRRDVLSQPHRPGPTRPAHATTTTATNHPATGAMRRPRGGGRRSAHSASRRTCCAPRAGAEAGCESSATATLVVPPHLAPPSAPLCLSVPQDGVSGLGLKVRCCAVELCFFHCCTEAEQETAHSFLLLGGQLRSADLLRSSGIEWGRLCGARRRCRAQGNAGDFYNASNSYLPLVLALGKGIPISLALVHAAVARRAGVPVHLVNMPMRESLPRAGSGRHSISDTGVPVPVPSAER